MDIHGQRRCRGKRESEVEVNEYMESLSIAQSCSRSKQLQKRTE